MTICDACKEHVIRRTKTQKDGSFIYLVNIPQSILSKMTLDELIQVRGIAKSGLMLCTDCHKWCRTTTLCPALYKGSNFITLLKWRNTVDTRVIASINREIERRKNILMAKLKYTKVLK